MRVLVAPFAAGVPLWNVGGTGHRRGDGPTNAAAKRSSIPSGKCGFADCQCWRNWER
jgi:hypothetical protein